MRWEGAGGDALGKKLRVRGREEGIDEEDDGDVFLIFKLIDLVDRGKHVLFLFPDRSRKTLPRLIEVNGGSTFFFLSLISLFLTTLSPLL